MIYQNQSNTNHWKILESIIRNESMKIVLKFQMVFTISSNPPKMYIRL